MGILSGLKDLGLGGLEDVDIFAEKEKQEKKPDPKVEKESVTEEKDFLLEKSFRCPVCDKTFASKVMKSGKTRLIGTDRDLRPKYAYVDVVKYDVIMCPFCGYASLSRYFANIGRVQAGYIAEKITPNVKIGNYDTETYSYEQALERYKIALACAVVKLAKNSEKAYICLKTAWILRGYQEHLLVTGEGTAEDISELRKMEEEYLANAYKGFVDARQKESFPMCGMDEITVDYLTAVLAIQCKKYDVASKLVSGILLNQSANSRMKERARELKDVILNEIRKA